MLYQMHFIPIKPGTLSNRIMISQMLPSMLLTLNTSPMPKRNTLVLMNMLFQVGLSGCLWQLRS